MKSLTLATKWYLTTWGSLSLQYRTSELSCGRQAVILLCKVLYMSIYRGTGNIYYLYWGAQQHRTPHRRTAEKEKCD